MVVIRISRSVFIDLIFHTSLESGEPRLVLPSINLIPPFSPAMGISGSSFLVSWVQGTLCFLIPLPHRISREKSGYRTSSGSTLICFHPRAKSRVAVPNPSLSSFSSSQFAYRWSSRPQRKQNSESRSYLNWIHFSMPSVSSKKKPFLSGSALSTSILILMNLLSSWWFCFPHRNK